MKKAEKLNINKCMVISVLYVGYRRGLHSIYLFAVLIATNTAFLPESAYLCINLSLKYKKMQVNMATTSK